MGQAAPPGTSRMLGRTGCLAVRYSFVAIVENLARQKGGQLLSVMNSTLIPEVPRYLDRYPGMYSYWMPLKIGAPWAAPEIHEIGDITA